MTRCHVVCRDCTFEGLASSSRQAELAVVAHRKIEGAHRVVFGDRR